MNERNNPFLDDADSNNIYLLFLPSTSETPARFRFVVGSREVASCCTVYIRSFQKSFPFSRSLRYLYTCVCARLYTCICICIHTCIYNEMLSSYALDCKTREWPAHSLGIGLVSSFNFRPLHKPSPIVRSRRESRGKDVKEAFLRTIRASPKDHLRDRIPPLGQKHLPSP